MTQISLSFLVVTALTFWSNTIVNHSFDLLVKSQSSAALTKRSNTIVNHSFDQKVKAIAHCSFDQKVKLL